MTHFAADENEVHFCTHLKGKASWFLPFNRGWKRGAGNPPNPSGLRSDYLWREVLTRASLSRILENYAQVVASRNAKTGTKKRVQIWPRYQQLDVVRRLLRDARTHGAGRRYLIQHSAGSGKSYSIAWLAHQLIPLERDGKPVFDSIIVVTDRRILDKQIRDTIRQYAQVGSTVGHAEHEQVVAQAQDRRQGGRSGDLRRFIGDPDPRSDGTVRHLPFHNYSMKQAIQEGFILDVLKHYMPVKSYYKLAKTVEGDPEFDVRKARKKLRRYVEGHEHAIRLKAEIMADHFHEQVVAQRKIDGKARAMVVTNGIERAIQYFHAIRDYLKERKSPYQAIVAFSGEHDFGGKKVSETTLNGFPPSKIAERFQEDPYRFLVCADKFQTGYDEPLLHTMYVDKTLSGIKAVQTLSRLNRAHPKKHDVFVLDFLNDTETITEAFSDYYRATILADETDPNKLHDLQGDLDGARVYSPEQAAPGVREAVSGRCGARPVGPHPGPLRGGVRERAGRRRAGRFQEQGPGVRPDLLLPLLDPPLQQPGLGGALDLPEFPDPEAAVARG